ncbi:hypothetical protein [Streptomyces sp. NPDC048172]|uniref:hypothetical protein n=1 Tax=Streptomyces sp. NPDC048172 TaxID=3365505 RepID=UPI0037148224
MRHRRTATTSLTALAAATALLLTGCGGGDDGGGDKADNIEGAGNDKKPAKSSSPSSPTKNAGSDFGTSDIKLPSDLKLTFDWKRPSDPEKAGALDGAADYMRALMHGTTSQNPKDPLIGKHSVPLQSAQKYATSTVKMDVEDKFTVTGEERYYREKVGDVANGKLAQVTFCSNQSKLFSKEVKSGKVLRSKPSDESYLHFTLVMQKPSKAGEPWPARSFDLKSKAVDQCKS